MKIVFPEYQNPTIQSALAEIQTKRATIPGFLPDTSEIIPLPASSLAEACQMVKAGHADTMIAGIDYSSRDVILACKDILGFSGQTFSGLAVMQRGAEVYLLADMAACKHPTAEQLIEIVQQTYASAKQLLSDSPRIALLSFSTLGSGGHDTTIDLMRTVRQAFTNTEILIDGEMQLDAAINPRVGEKKAPQSPVAGQANILIAPDLNTGNILYKAFEQLAGFTVAGPILQGFNFPVSDLSRGSTVADVVLTIEAMARLAHH